MTFRENMTNLLALQALLASCRGSASPPVADPPRVYEQGDCAAVMAIPGMGREEVLEGVVSVGITAAQNRVRAARAWDQAHRGHWVRWSVLVDARDPTQGPEGVVLARCLDRSSGLQLIQLNAATAASLRALQGGERVRVEGWLDERSLVLPTVLHVESLSVEAPPAPPAVAPPAPPAPPAAAPRKPTPRR